MIVFVECDVPSIEYRGTPHVNQSVNLGLCKSLVKAQFAWYPDNTGKPSITFVGCDVEWAFNTEAERDAQYAKLIATKYVTE